MSTTKTASRKRHVLVTTEHRGVFFGVLKGAAAKAKLVLTEARNVIHWHASVRGVLGLAATGPSSDCRIGPAVTELTIYDITAVVQCDPAAVDAFARKESRW